MIELHVRYRPIGVETYGQTSIMLTPDQEIHLNFKGSFNWIASYDGKEITIPQENIHIDPREEDIDFKGILIVESKRQVLKKIESFLNDLLN